MAFVQNSLNVKQRTKVIRFSGPPPLSLSTLYLPVIGLILPLIKPTMLFSKSAAKIFVAGNVVTA